MRTADRISGTIATIMVIVLVGLLAFVVVNNALSFRIYRSIVTEAPELDQPHLLWLLVSSGVVAFAGLAVLGLKGGTKGLRTALICLWIVVIGLPLAIQAFQVMTVRELANLTTLWSLVFLVPLTLYFMRSRTIAQRFGGRTRPGLRADAAYWWLRARGREPKPPSVFPEFE
ncbi:MULTISPECIES: hypothetical protein [unclassified Sphingomonas]|uniref:hypothetical protein n=1 Tax=unclassified Sphingomonas TaxID=196159 RepID=UPI0012E10E06|nr:MULTISPECIES: hypothetical protein [unclassified Sphingomonas]